MQMAGGLTRQKVAGAGAHLAELLDVGRDDADWPTRSGSGAAGDQGTFLQSPTSRRQVHRPAPDAFASFPEAGPPRPGPAIKEATLQELDRHLETLIGTSSGSAARHYAATHAEARSIIVDIRGERAPGWP